MPTSPGERGGWNGVVDLEGLQGAWGQASSPARLMALAACLPMDAWPPGSSGQLGWQRGPGPAPVTCLFRPLPQVGDKLLP